MRYVKIFEEFLQESSNTRLIDEILKSLETTILEMVEKVKAAVEKEGKTFTDYDRKMTYLSIIYDMVRSIEKYTLPTDKLVNVGSSRSVKGNIEVWCSILRDGEQHFIETEAIYAGGYNIQRLHYRYITKTNLPQTNRKEAADEYAAEIKKLSKLEKLNAEILSYEQRIAKNEERIQQSSGYTDEEIWQKIVNGENISKNKLDLPDWQEIVRRGADKNFDGEGDFLAQQAKYKSDSIDSWKRQNIRWPADNNRALLSEINKLKKKLENYL